MNFQENAEVKAREAQQYRLLNCIDFEWVQKPWQAPLRKIRRTPNRR